MSNAVYPALLGAKIDVISAPMFRTRIQESVSGSEVRAADMSYPKYRLGLAYEFLREGAAFLELQTIAGFFLARRGAYDSFLFTHPADNATGADMLFAIADGVKTQFQLTRTYGAGGFTFVEPVMNVNAITNLKRNGVTLANPADYTVSSTGLVTTAVPGTNGHALTWTGSFYYRCRFEKDENEYRRFMYELWELKSVGMIGSLGNKV